MLRGSLQRVQLKKRGEYTEMLDLEELVAQVRRPLVSVKGRPRVVDLTAAGWWWLLADRPQV